MLIFLLWLKGDRMATDDKNKATGDEGQFSPGDDLSAPRYPAPNMQVVYADAIWNVSRGAGVVKMYLIRNDQDFNGSQESKINVFAQLVMPSRSFVAAALFFNRQVNMMLANGEVTKAQVDELEAAFASQEASSAPANQ